MRILSRIFIMLLFLGAGLVTRAISIYEIEYEFPKLTDFPRYTAFLVRYGNGSGFMRVRYTSKDGKEVYLVNMEFDEVEGRSKIDGLPHLTLQFKGKNPVYIISSSKDKQNEVYNPDLLWFKKLTTDKNFKPWGVTSQNTDGSWEQGKIITVKLMNTEDLTKAKVGRYFKPDESFYVNLFTKDDKKPEVTSGNTDPVKPGNGTVTSNTGSSTIHFIIVANTNDPRIGYSVQRDVVNMTSQMKDVATFLKLPLNLVEVSGDKFGKSGVETALKNLKPASNDIVIFYYSGHGFSFDKDESHPYPQFDLRASRFDDISTATLNAGDILTQIKSKNARLNLVFCDCCNSNLGLLRPEGHNYALTAKSLLSWDRNYCSSLFLQSKGSLIATAAKKGQFAYGNTDVGGYFTSNLVTSLEKYMSKFQNTAPTWESIIEEAQSTTVALSLKNTCNANQSCRQDPVFNVDLK